METKKIKILIVEDNRADFHLVEALLRTENGKQFDLTWAPSYELALEELQKPYDAALLDFRLGSYTGLDLLRAAKNAGCRFPLIILTGYANPTLDQEAVAAGAADFLPKDEMTTALLRRTITHAIERVRVQEALAESELRFRSITESAADTIISADSAGRITSWNSGAHVMFGYTGGEILGKPVADLIVAGNRAQFEAEVDRLRTGLSSNVLVGAGPLSGLSAGGTEFPVEVSLSSWLTGGSRFFGLVIRDISKRLLAETRLAEERNLLRSIIDNLPDHIYVKDLEGRYIVNNAAHLNFMGAGDPAEIIGKTVFDLFPPEIAASYHMDDLAVIRANRPSLEREEPTVDRPHGEQGWLSTSKIPLRDTGSHVAGLVCLSRDITKRKQAEAAREQSAQELRKVVDELKQSNAELRDTQMMLIHAEKLESLGRLSAGIAHEVKNPLNQLLLGTEYLQRAIPAEETIWAEVLDDMHGAILRMDKILRGMLEYAAPNELDLNVGDPNEALESALLLMRLELIKGHVTIEKDLAAVMPRVALDRTKVGQVLINLFGNALHAMPHGGKVTVKTHCERIRTGAGGHGAPEETLAVMEITDSGHGIPEDKLGKIFDPFFTTKPNGQGTGLGLTVSKKIIELHGGTLELFNSPAGGVTARIAFPGCAEDEAQNPTPIDTPGRAG